MAINPNRRRLLLILLAGISLLTGLWAGLARMGWLLPIPNSQFVLVHGPLMVVGFLGALIGLERAVALKQWWAYGIPILSALSALSGLVGGPLELGNTLWFIEAAVFTFVPWWVGFLVLMIAGERLELSRLRQPTALIRGAFHASVAVLVLGLGYSYFDFLTALRLAGVGLLALALWLLRYDLVWQSVRQPGLPRFMALCLIAGYVWLAVGGILWIGFAQFFSAGPRYDAMLHTIFLGFVFSMIFAHAPIILPTIMGLALPFQNVLYLHAGLLHLSLMLRIAGDLGLWLSLQQWGGFLNTLAILLFLINNVRAVKMGAPATSRFGLSRN
jgi:hypothetical protein